MPKLQSIIFLYISVRHPVGASPAQRKEAQTRANKIYSQVKKSKKLFSELVTLYSDDKLIGADFREPGSGSHLSGSVQGFRHA